MHFSKDDKKIKKCMKKYFIKEFINIKKKNDFAIYSFTIDVTTKF